MGGKLCKDLEAFLFAGEENGWAFISNNPFIGVIVCDNTGYILHANEPHAYITGKVGQDVVGKNIKDFVDERYIYRALTLEVLKCGHSLMEEQSRLGRSYMVKAEPLFTDDGAIAYVVSLLLDVSLDRTLRQHLRKTQEDKAIMQKRLDELQQQLDTSRGTECAAGQQGFLYVSRQMRNVHTQIDHIANSSSAVLITGESGVGKELAAKTIQRTSNRKDMPFISINCAAMPSELLESELFGYVGGAFTNSMPKGKAGLFESARGGTIFLDEIGEMPRKLQAKLLRVLQEKEIRRVGGTASISTDVRILAATNLNLQELVDRGRFRKDLYYRLNVIPIHIPALRERKDDIPILAYSFLDTFNKRYGKNKVITSDGYNYLIELPYSGNVRQLENVIERIVLLCQEEIIMPADIQQYYSMINEFQNNLDSSVASSVSQYNREVEAMLSGGDWKQQRKKEEVHILRELARQGLSTYQIAQKLGLGQSTVWRKLKKIREERGA